MPVIEEEIKNLDWDNMGCIVCGRDNSQKIAEDKVKKNKYTIIKCRECGFIFANQRERYLRDKNFFHLEGLKKNVFLDSLLKIDRFANGRDLLDIGAGLGYFLHLAKQKGYNVSGIEPSKSAAEHAKNLYKIDLKEGFLSEVDFGSKKFDIITAFDVIEHLLDVRRFLMTSQILLRPGGILVLRFPNATQHSFKEMLFRPIYNMTKKTIWCAGAGSHINFFSNNTMRLLLEDMGFEVVLISSSKTELSNNKLLSFLRVIYELFAKLVLFISGVYVFNSMIVIAKRKEGEVT